MGLHRKRCLITLFTLANDRTPFAQVGSGLPSRTQTSLPGRETYTTVIRPGEARMTILELVLARADGGQSVGTSARDDNNFMISFKQYSVLTELKDTNSVSSVAQQQLLNALMQ